MLRMNILIDRFEVESEKSMTFELIPLCEEHKKRFKTDMQLAFQQGAVSKFGEITEEILPEGDIDNSLNADGAAAYEAILDGTPVGGVIVVIDEKTQHNHLDFLFVKTGTQGSGIGQAIWDAVEARYPQTKVWETCTPYFEKRNIHFYVNRCGFHIVEFYNKHHPDPNSSDIYDQVDNDFFRFEKWMQ